jgi:hypothetical protein
MLKIGTVTDNQDPEQLRRIKVTTIDRGTSSSQWLSRITNFDGDDLPAPQIGSTVVISEIGGDTTEEVILGVLQTATTNKPSSDKPDLDPWWSVLSAITFWVSKTFSVKSPSPAKPEITLDTSGWINASNSLGSVQLLPDGYLMITNPTSMIVMSGSGISINTPGSININSNALTWNGSQVAVVGGYDTDGDTTLS